MCECVCLCMRESVHHIAVRRQLSGVHSFPLFGVAGMKQRPLVLALLPTKLPHHAVTIIFKGFYRRYKSLTSVICSWIKMEWKLCHASGWVTAVTWDMTALGVSTKGRVLAETPSILGLQCDCRISFHGLVVFELLFRNPSVYFGFDLVRIRNRLIENGCLDFSDIFRNVAQTTLGLKFNFKT